MTEELLPDEGMDSLEDLEKNKENGLDVELAVDALEVDRQGPTSSDVSSQETNMEEPALPHGTVSDSPQADDTAGEEPEPGRLQKIMAPILRWTVLFVVVFGLGVLVTMLLRVRPQKAEIEQLRQDASVAAIALEELEDQLSQQKADNARLEGENSSLAELVDEGTLHLQILRALVDVTTAEVALHEQDITTAKAALAGTEEKLDALRSSVSTDDRTTIDNMRKRLNIVLSEMDDDYETALIDLGVLDTSLSALERSLFGE